MTAFDTVWSLFKMPIMQGSVYRNYDSEAEDDDFKRYGGAFDDPETGERMNMEAVYHPEGSISATIDSPPDDTYKLHPRASGTFTHHENIRHNPKPWQNDTTKWSASGIGTDDEHRRKGYATGIYDMVAYILNRHGGELVPSTDQTKPGSDLWDSVLDDLEDDEPERWRIRGDLG